MTDENRLHTPAPGVLERTFGLSRAEAKCAIALGEGTVDQAAVRLGVSPHTVRTQLKQVYAKTACSSRSDLTRLLLSLAKG
jgi:DNA-binding CsgD family transcriptional regulator